MPVLRRHDGAAVRALILLQLPGAFFHRIAASRAEAIGHGKPYAALGAELRYALKSLRVYHLALIRPDMRRIIR